LNIFNKPYPFNDDLKYNTKFIFFTSIGVFIFLFLFQPFNISTLPVKEKYYLMLGFAGITFLSLSLNLMLIPSMLPNKFSSVHWTIKREILWNLWILFTILVGYFFLNNSLGVLKVSFSMVIKLVLMAVVPITALIIVNQNKILRSHLKLADELNRKLKENKLIEEKIIYFNSDYQKGSLAIKINHLLFIRSANNYIEIFWKEGGIIKKQMVRCSMANVEENFKEYKFIIKCHRSYMVNINHIEKIEGNSQGYKLFFENVSFSIPVSKNSVAKLQELI
jgi:hypothetical protein